MLGAGASVAFSGFRGMYLFKTPDWSFLQQEENSLAHLAEMLIPATDTPGAMEAGVAPVMVQLIKDTARRVEQNNFIEGLRYVLDFSKRKFGKVVSELNFDEQTALMNTVMQNGNVFSGLAGKVERKLTGRSFTELFREYASVAYCTSQPGATQALAYAHIPARYDSCIDKLPAQRSWATK